MPDMMAKYVWDEYQLVGITRSESNFGVFVKALWPLMNQDEPSLPVVPATESLSRQLGGGSERPLWGEAPDEPTEWHGIWPYRRWLPENLSPEVRLASLLTMQFCYFGAKAAAIDGFGPSGATPLTIHESGDLMQTHFEIRAPSCL